MLVSHILNSKPRTGVETIPPAITVREAAETLAQKKIGALIVSGDGAGILGILSERDIVRELAVRGASCLNVSVDAIMTTSVKTCTPSDTVGSISQRMSEGRFRHMPVVEDGRLCGVISIGDVVKARMSEIEGENAALTNMIAGSI